MGLVEQRSEQTDQADMAILSFVETIQESKQPCTPSAVASLIGGAPVAGVARRLHRLFELSLVDEFESLPPQYRLTQLGAELLARDLIGWTPGVAEQRRRDSQMRSSIVGSLWTPDR